MQEKSDAGKNKRQQEKRKTIGMFWRWMDFRKEATGPGPAGAEQGCCGQGTMDIAHLQDCQELELTQ